MRVLFVEHNGRVSGGQRSLVELLRALPGEVETVVACPAGALADMLDNEGFRRCEIPSTDASLKLHPVHTSRGVLDMMSMALSLRRVARRLEIDLVHANSIRAGLVCSAAMLLGGPPLVVHVRDALPDGRVAKVVRWLVRRRAAGLIAISRYTAARFGSPPPLRVVHNAVDPARFDPSRISRAESRMALGLPADGPLLGVLGQITPWKRQDDAIRALAQVRDVVPDAELLIAGEAKFVSAATRYDNLAYLEGLHRLADRLGVAERVHFVGERDAASALAALDVLLVPSEEEPFGRVVIEGMSMRLPVIATSVGGPKEIITDGRDGVLLPPGDPSVWARRVAQLLADAPQRETMGTAARNHVIERFGPEQHAREVTALYRMVLNGGYHN